ncbi:MAG: 50S ribosomal protein L15 [Actinomycetes bacterium]|jgi:large subunit ribosomal protein L15|nr:50S ribosomal protein L15 [Actinomycetes bacterium]
MQLNDLIPAPGSRKARKRVGRGHGSGRGGTSTRGSNGQLSRPGGGKGPGFEGGQLPLAMRLPKLGGFVHHGRTEYAVVNVGRLDTLFSDGDEVTPEALEAKGAIKSALKLPVKVLGNGELTKKLTVRVEKISAAAAEKIEKAGGKVE